MGIFEILGLRRKPKNEREIMAYVVGQCQGMHASDSFRPIADSLGQAVDSSFETVLVEEFQQAGRVTRLLEASTLEAQSTVARSITFEAIVKEHELHFLARQKTSQLRLVAFAWERFPSVFSYLSDSVGGTDLASPEALDFDKGVDFIRKFFLRPWMLSLCLQGITSTWLPFFRGELPQKTLEELEWLSRTSTALAGDLYAAKLGKNFVEIADTASTDIATDIRRAWEMDDEKVLELEALQSYLAEQTHQITRALQVWVHTKTIADYVSTRVAEAKLKTLALTG